MLRILKLSKSVYSANTTKAPTVVTNVGNIGNPPINTSTSETQLYVCDMDLSVTEDILKNFFTRFYTSVTSAKIIIDPKTKQSKGYGFVRFRDTNEANRALTEMNGKYILSKPVKVK